MNRFTALAGRAPAVASSDTALVLPDLCTDPQLDAAAAQILESAELPHAQQPMAPSDMMQDAIQPADLPSSLGPLPTEPSDPQALSREAEQMLIQVRKKEY
jgi:hypothetical protein